MLSAEAGRHMPDRQKLFDLSANILSGNLRTGGKTGNDKYLYIAAGGKIRSEGVFKMPFDRSYPHSWFWDTWQAADALATDPQEAETAKNLLLYLQLSPEGFVPHIRYQNGSSWPERLGMADRHGGFKLSRITQPTNLAKVALEVYKNDPKQDRAFLGSIFHTAWINDLYLFANRAEPGELLVRLISPLESGRDHSPSFDATLGLNGNYSYIKHDWRQNMLHAGYLWHGFDIDRIMKQKNFHIAAVDFNCMLYEDLLALGNIAEILGKDREKSVATSLSLRLKDEINSRMWDEKLGAYCDLDRAGGRVPVITVAALYPLMMPPDVNGNDFLTDDRKQKLFRLVVNEFMSPYGIRSVAKSEPAYQSGAYWRGDIWANITYRVAHACHQSSLFSHSSQIDNGFLDNVSRYDTLYERYDAQTGVPLGARDFSWTAAYVQKMIRLDKS